MGDANKDHACWERPEDMDTSRSVFKVDRNTPGSDVAAETAAALAAASVVFRRSDPTYSKLLIRRAIRVRFIPYTFKNRKMLCKNNGISTQIYFQPPISLRLDFFFLIFLGTGVSVC